jgi:hypothetical protein
MANVPVWASCGNNLFGLHRRLPGAAEEKFAKARTRSPARASRLRYHAESLACFVLGC